MQTRHSTVATNYDEGLRRYLLSIFNNMALGLLISAVTAAVVGTNPQLLAFFFGGPQKWLVILAPLAFVFLLSFGIWRMSPEAARACFFAYAGTVGLSLATIFAFYKLGSIVSVFFVTASMFGVMSIYGYTTKTDLTKFGSFLIMGIWGLVIAGLVNLFFQSSVVSLAASIIAVFLFCGMTAYDVQMFVAMYDQLDEENRERAGIMGALSLYLDFINLFVNLLRLFGEQKN